MYLPEAEQSTWTSLCHLADLEDAKSALDLLPQQWNLNGKRTVVQSPLPWRFASLFWKGEEERKREREEWAECAEFSELCHEVGAVSF